LKLSDQPIDIPPRTIEPLPPHASVPAGIAAPIGKVANPAWCSLAATLAVFIANKYFKLTIPPEVAMAGMGLIALWVGYVTPLKQREIS
jgi:hypothetical protein